MFRLFRLRYSLLLLVFLGATLLIYSNVIKRLSFEKNAAGDVVLNDWQIGGSSVANKRFIRLTPDRQSKKGWMWNSNRIEMDEFSLIFHFRISGNHPTLYGDGIAVVVSSSDRYVPGDFHGFTDRYTGFAIVFDTFVNTYHSHKDVSVYVNDGSKSLDMLMAQDRPGCNVANLRFHEKSPEFRPSKDMSRAKIQFKNNWLKVMVDKESDGNWTSCFETQMTLPTNFGRQASIGISASTGSLADNHDALELLAFDMLEDPDHIKKDEAIRNKRADEVNVNDMSLGNTQRLNELQRQFSLMQEDLEHQLAALKEETENTLAKMKRQEVLDQERIIELQRMVSKNVDNKMKMTTSQLNEMVQGTIEQKVTEKASSTGGWKLPFFFLVVTVLGIVSFIYKKYQDLRKSHLL